jgi:hypothetical protein
MSRERHTSALRAHNGHGDGGQLPCRTGHRERDAGPPPDQDGAEVPRVLPPHADSRTLRASTGSTVPDKVAQRLVLAQLW